MPTSLGHCACWLVLSVLLVTLPACHSQNERVVRQVQPPYPHSRYFTDLSRLFMTPGPNASISEGKYYRTLTLFNGRLFVGGKDQLFSLNPADLSLIDSAADTGSCNGASDCSNYIRVIQPLPTLNNTLLECGTNNGNPYCQQRSQDLSEIGSLVSLGTSETIVPLAPTLNSTGWLLTDGNEIYVGTYLTLSAGNPARPAISKSVLQLDSSLNVVGINVSLATKDDTNVLDANQPQPQFVGDPISYNGRIYFFYRGVAAEFVERKAVHSRVAVVCENDRGGRKFEAYTPKDIVTFAKMQLECSTGTTFPYHYNEIRDIYHSNGTVFAAFATPPGVAGSAVCAYRLDEIEALFLSTSKFRAQFSDGELWREVDTDPVTPRPAQCPNTTSYADAQYSAILGRAQLMFDTAANKLHYESPGGARSNPLLMIDGERFTQIVVDENVINDIDVMFIGTEDGTVLKTYLSEDRSEAQVAEELSLNTRGLNHTAVLTMLKSDADQAVFVGTDRGVYKVPFQHCSDYTTCGSCVGDPYCCWKNGRCLHLRKGLQGSENTCPPCPVKSGESKTINFTITVDDSSGELLSPESLDELSRFDWDISQYKFDLNNWIGEVASSCNLQTCKRHP
ncbi:semaphorin-2A-like isoform X2 [Acanthaster planci]|uniref:Semaphorin-2A-like isoform X2 n=1 Tax=Acanthaster planci TaxID=133434 RepID=A0A8B7ZDR8_ACAPL|nr:semaphorin-2A-like isoform X2 [Acanthaster planci]